LSGKRIFTLFLFSLLISCMYSCEEDIGIGDLIPPDFSGEFYPPAHQDISSSHPVLMVRNFRDFNGYDLVYDFQLFSDSWKTLIDQAADVVSGDEYTEWSVNISLNYGKRYYWRVRAKSEYSTGDWKVSTDFRIKNIFPPEPFSPRNGETLDSATPMLCIENSEGIGGKRFYDFQIYSDEALTQRIVQQVDISETTGHTCWQSTATLSSDRNYYWRVRARIGSEYSDWTSPLSFYICACNSSGGNEYAQLIIEDNIDDCDGVNQFLNGNEALGPPNASGSSESDFSGFVSLGLEGSITVDMKVCIFNGPGYDLRVFQYISKEPVEILASSCRNGTYYSLGIQECTHPFCRFDISNIPLNEIRFIKIVDRSNPIPCYSHIGADIDAIEAIHYR